MKSFINRLWVWITRWFWRREKPLSTVWVEELPDTIKPNVIYIAGENEYLWFAAMLCPCGCGETLYMNLQTETRPCWKITIHSEGTVTMHPSVWRQVGCRSHFFIRHGLIQWCESALQ